MESESAKYRSGFDSFCAQLSATARFNRISHWVGTTNQ